MNEINNFLEATGRAVLTGIRWIITVVCVGMFVFLVINLIALILKAV